MKIWRCLPSLLLFLATTAGIWAKQKPEPTITLLWPDSSSPTLKLEFGKFVQQSGYGAQKSFACDVVVQNVSAKRIPRASLNVRLMDKEKVRIGDSVLNVNDLGPNESTRIAFQFLTAGIPASVLLAAHNDANGLPTSLKTVPLKIMSVPPGAKLKVDGQDAGTTPKAIYLLVGTHILEFSKEGYAPGSTPVDINADELAGGSITFELGGLSTDTVELRDGTVVQGDVVSISTAAVVLRVAGIDQSFDRNRVKRISFVEREAIQQMPQNPTNTQK
jgi:hypothetical protein